MDRIRLVKSRLPAWRAKAIIGDLALRSTLASRALHIPVSTLNRKTREGEALSQDGSERVLGLARLIGQV